MNTWTIETYLKYAKKQRKEFRKNNPNSSKPQKLFKQIGHNKKSEEYIFSNDNWNDADLVRECICSEFENKSKHFSGISYKDKTIFVFFTSRDDIKRASIIVDTEYYHDEYELQWYKNRGRTDLISKNGYPILLEDYVNLINILSIEP